MPAGETEVAAAPAGPEGPAAPAAESAAETATADASEPPAIDTETAATDPQASATETETAAAKPSCIGSSQINALKAAPALNRAAASGGKPAPPPCRNRW